MTALHPPNGEPTRGDSRGCDTRGTHVPAAPQPGDSRSGTPAPRPWEPGGGFEAEITRARRYERRLAVKALLALAVVALLVLARVYLFS